MSAADRRYVQRVVEDIFAFVRGVILPSIGDLPPNLQIRFSLRELDNFRAGVFRSALGDRHELYVTAGLALETYSAIRSLPAKERRFLRRQFPSLQSSRTYDFPSGFTFVCAIAFVIAHELSHVLAGHVDFFRYEGQRPSIRPERSPCERETAKSEEETDSYAIQTAAISKIREIEADGFATFLIHAFRRDLAASCFDDDDEPSQAFASGAINEAYSGGLSRLSLFGMLLFAILLERHHEDSDVRTERPGFAHARLVYICVGHILLERPDLARYDDASKQIVFDSANRERLTEYFALDVLPVLICCQRAADAAGIPLNIVPISDAQSKIGPSLISEIAAIVSGQKPGRTAGGEQLAHLGHHLMSWYERIGPFRQVRTHT